MLDLNDSPVDLTLKMIRFRTISPEDCGLQKEIGRYLQAAGFQVRHLDFGKVFNLYATYGTGSPNICLVGHTDVVPPGDEKKWSTPPFEGKIVENRVVGRGACDMKGGVACQMVAAKQFVEKRGKNFKGKISLVITGNEETSTEEGALSLLEQLQKEGEKIDYALVGEPTNPKELGEVVKQGRRGIIHGDVVIQGKQGHVAYPHLAKNPLHWTLTSLERIVGFDLDGGKPREGFPPSNLQITDLRMGAGAYNVIPGELSFKFAIRYNPACHFEKVEREFHQILQSVGLPYKMGIRNEATPFFSESSKMKAVLKEVIKKGTGREPEFNTEGGTSDGRFFAQFGIPVMEFGLAGGSLHQVDEWARIADIEKLTQIYEDFLAAWS
ncbi:MAG: succinyl-diaminopimelate desuccinylase [Deltaproteobacteria bacterium]|nr:succinyl-diaminopimelate desuccinylase [Deltaproteobacteria bacterium]